MRVKSDGNASFSRAFCRQAAVLACVAAAGCNQAPPAAPTPRPVAATRAEEHDHDHAHGKAAAPAEDHEHEHPRTLSAGVAELETLWGRVRKAMGKGDRDKADEHVHEVGHLLEDVEGLLATVPEESREVGKKAMEEIFDCFDSLDRAFHGDEDEWKKVDLEALAPRLEAAFKTLSALGGASAK
jgi:hypothetical protein